ncbi:nitroreductase family deazaflavin-dependent oxidoreductase [Actinopolymorpha pittospori]
MATEKPKIVLPRWLKPMNKVIVALQRLGLSLGAMHTLTVTGRRSGRARTTPVTPFTFEGARYVVGGYPGADWVANVRAAGHGTLATGRRRERVAFVELPVEEAGKVLAAFPVEVPTGVPMMARAGVVKDGTPEEFATLAGRCAVFRIDRLDGDAAPTR